MPLLKPKKWASKKAKQKIASKNISKMMHEGKWPMARVIAIWLSSAWLSKK